MRRTITRLFNSQAEAMRAVEALEAAGVDHDHISLIAGNPSGGEPRTFAHDGHTHEAHPHPHTAQDAGAGAAVGGILGGAAGLLAGLGMLAIPGMGPVLAAGFLTAAFAGAGAGAITGGLIGALRDAGENEDDAAVYAEGVRRGGTLISVRATDEEHDRAAAILAEQGGLDAFTRGADFRSEGWTGYAAGGPAGV